MFKQTLIDIGTVKVGSKKTVIFEYEGDLLIDRMVSGCHCTKPKHDPEKKQIIVEFKAPEIPKHLEYKGWYISSKKVHVFALSGTYTLEFKAKVIKK